MTKLLNREEAAKYIGIDPKTFDRVFRANPQFKRFMLGKHTERYTIESINEFIEENDQPLETI